MAKATKKQIKAQLTNEIALRYNKRIETLETELRYVYSELRECDNQRRKAEREVLELRDKIEQYEDWNRRLQEFMDMDSDEREKHFQEIKTRSEFEGKLNSLLSFYNKFFI